MVQGRYFELLGAGGQGLCSNLFASEQTTKEHSQRVEALHTIVLQFRRNCATIARCAGQCRCLCSGEQIQFSKPPSRFNGGRSGQHGRVGPFWAIFMKKLGWRPHGVGHPRFSSLDGLDPTPLQGGYSHSQHSQRYNPCLCLGLTWWKRRIERPESILNAPAPTRP